MGREKKTYGIRLDDDLVQDLQHYAADQNRNFSNMIETILKEYVAAQKAKQKGVDTF